MSEESEAIDNLTDALTVIIGATNVQLIQVVSNLVGIQSQFSSLNFNMSDVVKSFQKTEGHLDTIKTTLSSMLSLTSDINGNIDSIAKTDVNVQLEFFGTPKVISTFLKSQSEVTE